MLGYVGNSYHASQQRGEVMSSVEVWAWLADVLCNAREV